MSTKSGKSKQSCNFANCWALKLPEEDYCGTHLKEVARGHAKPVNVPKAARPSPAVHHAPVHKEKAADGSTVKVQEKSKQSCNFHGCWAPKIHESEYCGTHLKEVARSHAKPVVIPHVASPPRPAPAVSLPKPKPAPAAPSSSSSSSSTNTSTGEKRGHSKANSEDPSEPSSSPPPPAKVDKPAPRVTAPRPATSSTSAPAEKPAIPSSISSAGKKEVKESSYKPRAVEDIDLRRWVDKALGEPIPKGFTLQEGLKSGVRLCKIINRVKDGIVLNVYKQDHLQKDNIRAYLEACTKLGMKKNQLFQVDDLVLSEDLPAVWANIRLLAKIAQAQPGYTGPVLEEDE